MRPFHSKLRRISMALNPAASNASFVRFSAKGFPFGDA
jgi:hypothetical protein